MAQAMECYPQIWYNNWIYLSNLIDSMVSELDKKRKKIHKKVVLRMAEMIATMTAFVVIFSVLLTLTNWPAYSRIIQDMVDPTAMASLIQEEVLNSDQIQNLILKQRLDREGTPEITVEDHSIQSVLEKQLDDMGEIYPHEMRLEIPKVFDGTIPIKDVDIDTFDFADLYESENKIQESLREGVVHYPFTAPPEQYGNVFITGHSSYSPWDTGKYKDIFALLHKLDVGDQYFIYSKGKKYSYEVMEIFEIQPDDISVLNQPTDQKISTLMTCTPVGTTLRRLIVRADLVEVSP
jgi:LPXTG-site transpeptidase (sortase) family protein